jgi:mannose-6-phosphate isomerase-like protein (cupin superfamily)
MSHKPRRIVAATGADGKSRVVSDEAIPLALDPQPMAVTNVWTGACARVDNAAAHQGGFAGFAMSQMTDPVYSVMMAEYGPGHGQDDPGMHYTDTADHFFVVEGEVVLVLEDGEALLCQGDLGICRGAVHGWRNDSGKYARLLTFVLPAEPQERQS